MSEPGHYFVLEVAFHDGRRSHPAYIREGSPDWKGRLDAAVEHFENLHSGLAQVNVHCARSLAAAGVTAPERILEWPLPEV
jgi:hypothetical protein